MANKVNILEIFTEKPNLESVFIELINRPVQKSSLKELLDEMTPADYTDDLTSEEKEENN
jgi:ABC-2 type transport system ATP-binding protein